MTTKILVIDDDEAILTLIADVLGDDGYFVVAQQSSLQALDWTQQNPPVALVLVDLMMPGANGEEVIAYLHNDERYAATPILVLTASFDGRQIAERLKATSYLKKPFDIDVLRAEVERCLS
jgi:CheY-like chemotaxis protein